MNEQIKIEEGETRWCRVQRFVYCATRKSASIYRYRFFSVLPGRLQR